MVDDDDDGSRGAVQTWASAMARLQLRYIALADQLSAVWQEIEPTIRMWIADGDMLTEQQWLTEPENTHELYVTLKAALAEMDAATRARAKVSSENR